ncbi:MULTISPECIES: ABC transporter substrate-binding protein [unclassified Streptomyces]|uniref:ABC transporter substrate-binding protein n=1 Tax=unclassified Streptomyces TaxID=2593676 RepID=UPI0035DEE410
MTSPATTDSVLRPRGLTALLAALGLTMTAAVGCSAAAEEEVADDSTVRVAVVDAAAPSLPLLAERNGDFTDQGLDVTISSHPSTRITSFASSLGWEYDIAWGTPADVIAAAAQGHDITVIAGAYVDSGRRPQAQMYAAEAGPVGSPTDLRDRRMAVPSLSGTLFLAVLTSLNRAGVDVDDVRLVEVPFSGMLRELDAGRVDAVATVQPYMGVVEAAGHRPLGDPFLSIDSPAVVGMWIADRAWAESNPTTVSAFVAGLDSADRWASSHQPETRAFLASALEIPPATAATVPLPDWHTSISPDALRPWIAAVASSGQVHGTLPEAGDLVPAPGKN